MRLIKTLSCVVVLLAVMAACGGGGCNPCEADQPSPAVNCQAKPEACK